MDQVQGIAYTELRLSLCPIVYIKQVDIYEEISQHTVMTLTAILADEIKEEIIHQISEVVNLYYNKAGSPCILFNGRVTKLKLDTEGSLFCLTVEAKSYTYGMDITRHSRSFQDLSMPAHTVIKTITANYPKSDCLIEIPNTPIGELIMQYEETDWDFIKRFVSKYGGGLYPENGYDGLRYHAGLPRIVTKVNWDLAPYSVYKQLQRYNDLKNNYIKDLSETDEVCYDIEAFEHELLGAQLTYRSLPFYISSIHRYLKDGHVMGTYTLKQKKGHRQPRLYNERITGVSIEGEILEVQRNLVKAHLQIDKNQDISKAYWFPYSTVSASKGGSGWYCMPEVGERIRAYFPTHDEKEGYVITHIMAHRPDAPEENDNMGDPNNKNISTAQDKHIHFVPEGVLIYTDNGAGQVLLNRDGGVSLSGIDDISLTAVENIKFRAEKAMTLTADKKIDVLCEKDGHIEIKPGGLIDLNAKEIYENSKVMSGGSKPLSPSQDGTSAAPSDGPLAVPSAGLNIMKANGMVAATQFVEQKAPTKEKADKTLDNVLSIHTEKGNGRVRQLQSKLNLLGYTDAKGRKLVEDGEFGNNTLVAVNSYKNKHKLDNIGEKAGVVDQVTWAAIMNDKNIVKEPVGSKEYPLTAPNKRFGTIHYKDIEGGRIKINPEWVSVNITTFKVPVEVKKLNSIIPSSIQINVAAVPNFEKAFKLLLDKPEILKLIKTWDGTWVARHINWNPKNGISNHSWGSAVDINCNEKNCGVGQSVDPSSDHFQAKLYREVFKPAGFSWLHNGDPMHFELL